MLKDDLYHITKTHQQENTLLATIQLNYQHPIFGGHFPGQPVLPGACMLNMVQEVISAILQTKYQLKKAGNLKFIAPIDPGISPELEIKLTYKVVESNLQVTAGFSANEVVCFKMQGEYTSDQNHCEV